jgi:hypothetical protein
MKHLKNIEDYMSNINEGVNYNNASNADLWKVGRYQVRTQASSLDREEVTAAGENFLKAVKPFALSGNGRKDVDGLIKFCVDACKKHGVDLDGNNTVIDNHNYDNEIFIPVLGVGEGELSLRSSCSYRYLSQINALKGTVSLSAFFYSDTLGSKTEYSMDLANPASITKACQDFNKWRNEEYK